MSKYFFILFAGFVTILNHSLKAQQTPFEIVSKIHKGINLGNTFEPPTEAGWNNPKAQEYYFDMYKEAGFEIVRIPVRWDNYTSKQFPYRIEGAWLNRIEQVVNWGLSRGLYIIINSHHDNWIKEDYEIASNRERFDSIWSQISVRFKNKPDRLFFEVLNEPYGLTKSQNDEMHQRILSIIRKTNPTRIVVFQGNNWGGSDDLIQAAIPDDDYIIGSFHSYDPYEFGLQGEGLWGSSADINSLRNKFIGIKDWSDENNVPVLLGEFGSLKSCDYNSRMKHYKYYVQFAREFGFLACAWDDGGDFKIMDRTLKSWDEVKDILVYSSPKSPDDIKLAVYQDSVVKINWKNYINNNDSLIIQRKLSAESAYKNIATIVKDATSFLDVKPDTNKYYKYRVIAHLNDSTDIYSYPQRIFFPGWKKQEQKTFYGEPLKIPGNIEAEDFDKGGENVAYHDNDEGNSGGAYRNDEDVDIFESENKIFIYNIYPGEWYEYTVNVWQERNYDIKINIATTLQGGKLQLKIGEVLSDTIDITSSGSWTNTTGISTRMKLNAGEQVMRLSIIDSPLFNIDNIEFSIDTYSEKPIQENDQLFKVYSPQPNQIAVTNIKQNVTGFNLYNISGILIQSIPVKKENSVYFKNLKEGIYILQAMSDSGYISRKINVH